jgi:hypothetical protein
MTTTTENDHAEENARAWMETIREQVATIKAAEALANPGQTYDDALDAITEGPLSVQVRSPWYTPGEKESPPAEFEILLSTGGPALRIFGDLDHNGQPEPSLALQKQDWFQPWTDVRLSPEERDDLNTYACYFWFGEGA